MPRINARNLPRRNSVRTKAQIGQQKRRTREREQFLTALTAAAYAEGFVAARPSAARQLQRIKERVAEAAKKVTPKAKS